MVQGLAFLTKKSWHTKNLANQEKVWIAEQRDKAEVAKTAELAKQIKQEREEEEIQAIAGNSQQRLDRGIAWLYDGHRKDSETAKADAEKQSEDYLLGKPYEPQHKLLGDLEAVEDEKQGVNAVVAGVEAPFAEDSVANRNETFRLRIEDPMYDVARQKVRQEKAVEHRTELYLKAGFAVKGKESDGESESVERKRKKSHKKDKKRKGDKRKKKRRRRYSSSDDEDDDRKKSPDSYHKSHKRHRRSYSRSPSEISERRRRSRSPRRRRSRSPRHYRSRSRSPPESHRRYHRQDYDRGPPRSRRHQEFDRSNHSPSRRHREPHNKPPPASQHSVTRDEFGRAKTSEHRESDKFGLQGSDSHLKHAGNLGPERDLLERKRREVEVDRQNRMKAKQRRPISAAERQAALNEMKRDAAVHAASRDQHGRGDYKEEQGNTKGESSFLQQATAQAHGLQGEHQNLSDRLQQNRHRNQRNTDEFL